MDLQSHAKSKNTIDPEIMIKQYGADAVRWFIFRQPTEKDVQWSDRGVYLQINFYKSFGTSVLC